jgi:hypothetical protein
MGTPLTQSELARRAYAAYGRFTNGRNHRGEPMPAWDDLGVAGQAAWVAAVTEVRDLVLAPPES